MKQIKITLFFQQLPFWITENVVILRSPFYDVSTFTNCLARQTTLFCFPTYPWPMSIISILSHDQGINT